MLLLASCCFTSLDLLLVCPLVYIKIDRNRYEAWLVLLDFSPHNWPLSYILVYKNHKMLGHFNVIPFMVLMLGGKQVFLAWCNKWSSFLPYLPLIPNHIWHTSLTSHLHPAAHTAVSAVDSLSLSLLQLLDSASWNTARRRWKEKVQSSGASHMTVWSFVICCSALRHAKFFCSKYINFVMNCTLKCNSTCIA